MIASKLRKFKTESRLQLQYVYFSAETLWHIISGVSSSDRLHCLEDTICAIRQGLLLLNYTTEFSNPKDGESGQGSGGREEQNQNFYPSSPPQWPHNVK